jgi:hypothetical protein
MQKTGALVADMITLARLHAVLDSVVETEQTLAAIREGSAIQQHGVTRLGELLGEARELLRWLLARPETRHAVGAAAMRRESGGR